MAIEIKYDVNVEELENAANQLDELKSKTGDVQAKTESANKTFSTLGDSLQATANRINIFGTGLGDLSAKSVKAVTGLGGLTTGFKALDTVLKASVIGVIVTAVVSLGVALTKTTGGAKFLRDAMATLEGVVSGVVGVIINFKDILAGNKGLISTFDRQIKASRAVADITAENTRRMRSLSLEVAKLARQEEELNQKADDATLSLAEQNKFAEEASKIALKRAQTQRSAAQALFETANAEKLALAEGEEASEDLLNRITEAKIAVEEAETEITRIQLEQATRRRQIDQDEFELRLDYLIDYTDNEKAINERIIADQSVALEERQRLLEKTVRVTNEAFAQAFKLFNEQAGQRLDVNKLIEESDASVVFNYLRSTQLSEAESKRVLEFLKERRTFTQDLAEAEKALAEETRNRIKDDAKFFNEVFNRNFQAQAELAIMREQDEEKRAIARRNMLLQNTALTESERRLIIAQSEEEIKAIQQQATADKIATMNTELDAALQIANNLISIQSSIAGNSKGLATVQLFANQAVALGKALSSAFTGEPISSLTFIATLTGIVASTFAQARQILDSTPDFQPQQPNVRKFYTGGINIGGPEGIDTIPAMLNKGESVMTAKHTALFGPTLKAIHENRVDPELLNNIVLGNPQVIDATKVIPVETQRLTLDETGFTRHIVKRATTTSIRSNRYRVKA